MDSKDLSSPLLLKYLKLYESNPRSLAFAPLAEHYRKLGMLDRAMEVLKDGIKHNPTYVLGYLGLAFCYYDLKQNALAYSTLRPLVVENRDNIRLQKLYGLICRELGHNDEALETYKYLLFINPKDNSVSQQVRELEAKESILKLQSDAKFESEAKSFAIDSLGTSDPDGWTQVNLSTGAKDDVVAAVETKGQWIEKRMDVAAVAASDEPLPLESPIILTAKPAETFRKEVEHLEDDFALAEAPAGESRPLATHTLVNLYISQGYLTKAKNLLAEIIATNPGDDVARNRIAEITAILESHKENDVAQTDPRKDIKREDGPSDLMNFFDSKFTVPGKSNNANLENKFWAFHAALKNRSLTLKSK